MSGTSTTADAAFPIVTSWIFENTKEVRSRAWSWLTLTIRRLSSTASRTLARILQQRLHRWHLQTDYAPFTGRYQRVTSQAVVGDQQLGALYRELYFYDRWVPATAANLLRTRRWSEAETHGGARPAQVIRPATG